VILVRTLKVLVPLVIIAILSTMAVAQAQDYDVIVNTFDVPYPKATIYLANLNSVFFKVKDVPSDLITNDAVELQWATITMWMGDIPVLGTEQIVQMNKIADGHYEVTIADLSMIGYNDNGYYVVILSWMDETSYRDIAQFFIKLGDESQNTPTTPDDNDTTTPDIPWAQYAGPAILLAGLVVAVYIVTKKRKKWF